MPAKCCPRPRWSSQDLRIEEVLDSRNRKIQISVEVHMAEYKIASYWVCFTLSWLPLLWLPLLWLRVLGRFFRLPDAPRDQHLCQVSEDLPVRVPGKGHHVSGATLLHLPVHDGRSHCRFRVPGSGDGAGDGEGKRKWVLGKLLQHNCCRMGNFCR